MKLTAPWHRKVPPQTHETPSPATSSLDAISAQLDGLSRKVDRLDRVRQPVGPSVQEQSEEGIETAIAGLRSIVAHVASADALASLDRDVCALTEQVSGGSPPVASAASDAIGNLEQRIGSIADAIAAFRTENRRRTVRNLASLIEILNEKMEVLQVQQANASRPDLAPVHKPTRPVADANSGGLDSIERGIA